MSLEADCEEKEEPVYLEGEPVPLKEEPIFLEDEPLFLEEPLPLKEEPHFLKEEPIWDIAAADLYTEHEIKNGVVVGPIMLQPPDAAFATPETSCEHPAAPTTNATRQPLAKPVPVPKVHRCYICQRTFFDDSLLINHVCLPQQVLDARTVPHTVREKRTCQTDQAINCNNVIRNYSAGELIYCDICQKQFKHKCTLKIHKLTHFEAFSCKLCNVKFKYENDLDTHYKDHAEFDNGNAIDEDNVVRNRVGLYASKQRCTFIRIKDTAPSSSSSNVASLQLPKCGPSRQILKQGSHKPNSNASDEQFMQKYLNVNQGSRTDVSTLLDISAPRQNLIQGSPEPNSTANNEQFTQKYYQIEHQRSHAGPPSCEIGKKCPLRSDQNIQSDRSSPKENPNGVEVNSNRPKSKDKLEKYMYCEICKKQIKVKQNLNAHMQAHIRKKQRYCEICKKYFHSRKYLIQHKKIHTGEMFPCHLCRMTFMAERLLLIHKRIHIGEETFTCDICQKVFKRKLKLISHVKNHSRPRTNSGIKHFSCDICEKKFSNNTCLSSHKLVHVAEREYSCEICKKRFHLKRRLLRHVQYVHEGKKPFKCETCQKAFPYRRNLSEHELLHGEKKLICNICGKKFHQKSGLLKHVTIHSDRNPFICDVCKRQFKRKTALISHIKIKHTEGHSTMSLTDYIQKLKIPIKSYRRNRVEPN